VTISERVLNRTTLLRQSLLERTRENVAPAVGRLAGMQAQHANAPHVALWSRVAGFESAKLEGALERRTVVKATTIRSTLHIVAAADYPAFDAASAVPRVAVWNATVKRAGVDIAAIHRKLLDFADEPRTMDELERFVGELAPGKKLVASSPSGVTRVAFRIVSAHGGLVRVPPSGFWGEHGAPRFVAARTWLKDIESPPGDEGLQQVIRRYLGAYGPASIADIGRWLGERRMPRLRKALDALGDAILRDQAEDGRELVDLAGAPLASGDEDAPVRFLSRWDSVVIGYDDRARILPPALAGAVFKKNADVLSTFLVDGLIGGTWTIETVKGRGILRLTPLVSVPRAARAALEEEGEQLVRFVERDAARHELGWVRD
jgi:Winged helix DNA-binding domain